MANNISFKSTFRPVTSNEFSRVSKVIPQKFFVDFPWTINEAVKAKSAYTNNVWDCSVLGITDGKEVLLLHLCPTIRENLEFNKIKNFILRKINVGNENLQAVLLGSQDNFKNSEPLNSFLKSLMAKLNIPCSVLKNGVDDFRVAYFSDKDEWILASQRMDKDVESKDFSSEEILKRNFKEVELSSFDEFA